MFNPFVRKAKTNAASLSPPVDDRAVEVDVADPELDVHVSGSIAEVELVGNTVVATITVTELTDDQGSAPLANLLYELSQFDARHVVLDIQNVQFMDSACLGCLVQALNLMTNSGGKIALANADHAVQSLFRLTRLDRVFPICHDVMSAIDAVEKEDGAEDD